MILRECSIEKFKMLYKSVNDIFNDGSVFGVINEHEPSEKKIEILWINNMLISGIEYCMEILLFNEESHMLIITDDMRNIVMNSQAEIVLEAESIQALVRKIFEARVSINHMKRDECWLTQQGIVYSDVAILYAEFLINHQLYTECGLCNLKTKEILTKNHYDNMKRIEIPINMDNVYQGLLESTRKGTKYLNKKPWYLEDTPKRTEQKEKVAHLVLGVLNNTFLQNGRRIDTTYKLINAVTGEPLEEYEDYRYNSRTIMAKYVVFTKRKIDRTSVVKYYGIDSFDEENDIVIAVNHARTMFDKTISSLLVLPNL